MSEELKNGEPCFNPSCLRHVSKACEECGRIAGRSNSFMKDYEPIIDGIRRIVVNETNADNLKLLSIGLEELKQRIDTIYYHTIDSKP